MIRRTVEAGKQFFALPVSKKMEVRKFVFIALLSYHSIIFDLPLILAGYS